MLFLFVFIFLFLFSIVVYRFYFFLIAFLFFHVFYFFVFMYYLLFICFVLYLFHFSLFPRKFSKFKAWPWTLRNFAFFHHYFQENFENQCWFLKNLNGLCFFHVDFSRKKWISTCWKIIVEKRRNSLNSRPAIEFKQIPRK